MPARPTLPAVLGLATMTAALAATPAFAARSNITASRTAVAQAISDCRKVADKDARLACYDKAADAFEEAQAQGQVVVVDRAQVREVKRQSFGFAIPSLNLFSKGPKEEEITRISVKLSGTHQDQNGKWVMTTEEGAVWSQIDSAEVYDPPHAGSTVVIRRASLGSFFCNIDNDSAIRCTRTQ
jgi:hypothetical protein